MQQTLPKTSSTLEDRVIWPDEVQFTSVQVLVEPCTETHDVNTIDGVRINFGHGWGLIRSSNTQPVIVVRIESETKKGLEEIKQALLEKMQKYPEITGYEDLDIIIR